VLAITQEQKEIYMQITKFVLDGRKLTPAKAREVKLSWVNNFPARDRQFLIRLADELKLVLSWDEYDEDDQNLAVLRLPISAVPPPAKRENGEAKEDSSEEEVDGGEAGRAAVDRVLRKYSSVKTLEEQGDFDQRYDVALRQRMDEWKQDYYREKLHIDYNDKEQVNKLAYRYIEGLQWVMYYYYSGVASWSWFYDYHYAPRMSGRSLLLII
jgi:5'-3' exoribonuclease 1